MNRPMQPQGSRPMDTSDARTLALATPPLTASLISQWVTGQQANLEVLEAEASSAAERPRRLAEGHTRALLAAGLDAQVYAQVESVIRAFCGVMTTVEAVEKKRVQLGDAIDSAEQRERLTSEIEKLRALTPLRQRHGDEAVGMLLNAAPQLMDLHARLHRALRD